MNARFTKAIALLLFLCGGLQLNAQNPLTTCIGFGNQPTGTSYSANNGYGPGSVIMEEPGFSATLGTFNNLNAPPGFGYVQYRDNYNTITPPFTLGQGNALWISNATVLYEFPSGTNSVCFSFWAGNGTENIGVNGQAVQVVNFPFNIPQNLAPGVTFTITPINPAGTVSATGTMCLTGNIQSLRIGGQEFFMDNLCYTGTAAPCPALNLQVTAQPCTPNGIFYTSVNPGVPASNTASGYRLFINGDLRGTFTYAQGTVNIGPFTGDGTTTRTFIIQDNNNLDCRDTVVLAPVNCNLTNCVIEDLQAYVVDCTPQGYIMYINFASPATTLTGTFQVTIGGENYGTFSLQQLPLILHNVQVPANVTSFEVRVCRVQTTPAQCCRAVQVNIPNCPVDQCIGFEYIQGTAFGGLQGNQPGDLIYTENNVAMRLLPFQDLDWVTTFLELRVGQAPGAPPFAAASGKFLMLRGIGLSFNFSQYPEPVDSVSVDFFNQGQVNIAANGGQLLILPNLTPGTYTIGPGVTMTVLATANTLQQGKLIFRGNIFSLRIGGGLLRLDNMCILNQEPCEISELRVEALPCVTAAGQFSVRLNFHYQGVADSFALYVNSNVPTIRAYADLPLTLGPFQSPSQAMTFIVADRANGDCRAAVTLAPVSCAPSCQLSAPEYFDIQCNNALTYNVRIKFARQGTGAGFRVRSEGGYDQVFPYGNEPTLLTGIPVPNDLQDVLLICDTQYPGCCVELSIQVPCLHDCQITQFRADALPCRDDGTYMVRFNMNHENTSPGFRLRVNGQAYGEYLYADLPITIGPFPGNGQSGLALRVQDNLFACVAETSLAPVNCNTPPCHIENLQAFLINCANTNSTGYLHVNFDHAQNSDQPFELYINNQLIGIYELSQLPLMLPWPLPLSSSAFQVRVCMQDNPVCCAQTEAQRLNCDAEGCIGFEQLPLNAIYGSENGHEDGDLVFTEAEVPVRLRRFQTLGAPAILGNARVTTNAFPGFTRAQGQYLELRNINLEFNFEALHEPVISVCFDYFDGGATENFSVNGQPIRVIQSFFPLNGVQVAPGVFLHLTPANSNIATGRACLTGPIRSLLIGGQRFGLDNICYNTLPQPCRIAELTATASPCTDANQFTVSLTFQHQHTGAQGFTVRGNGVQYGTFSYADLPITLGPFSGSNTREFEVRDVANPACLAFVTLTPPSCNGIVVWPGDADNNNVANHFDLLNIGVAYGFQGPARNNSSNNWAGMPALAWPQTFANASVNYAHADCNGNGLINAADVEVIRQNYRQVHGPVAPYVPLPATPNNPPLFVDMPGGSIAPGTQVSAPIVLGRANLPVEAIYGLAFRIEFNPEVFVPNSVGVEFMNTSWLGGQNPAGTSGLITIDRSFAQDGFIEVALSRINHQNIGGNGAIARFHGIIDDIAGITQSEIRITQIRAIRANETPLALYNPVETFTIGNGLLDIGWLDMFVALQVYPNPTGGEIFIENKYNAPIDEVQVYNDKGMQVSPALSNTNRVSLANLPSGMYYLKIRIGENVFHKRVVRG